MSSAGGIGSTPAAPVYRCLNYTFSVSASDESLAALIDRLYEPFRSDDEPTVHYSIIEWAAAQDMTFVIYANATVVRTMREPDIALAHFVWAVNQAAIATSVDHWLLHAAAAEREGDALLLSAPSGSGKSTLVSSLVGRGCGYLTDDVAVMEPASGEVIPYPKPIGFDRSAHDLLPEIRPVEPEFARYTGSHGFLVPADLGGVSGRRSRLRSVVLLRFDPSSANSLEEVGRLAAAELLADQSFSVPIGTENDLQIEMLAALLEGVACYRLVHSDLASATDLLLSAAL